MAKVIIGGQALSLLLSLLATPVAYSLLDDLNVFVRRLFARKTPSTSSIRPATAALQSGKVESLAR